MRRVFICFLEEIEDTKKIFRNYLIFKGSLSYRLCFEYFSQFKIDSETYKYLEAVLKETK